MIRNSAVIDLCVEGTRAEYEGRMDDARALYARAWESVGSDFEACVAAHYVARFQANPKDRLRWNRAALEHAAAANQDEVRSFYPSLYLNLGQACELLDRQEEAQQYYDLAESLGALHFTNNKPPNQQEQRRCKQ